jgi:fermentation-respiration switch protein FrsA (DUF1100 family)
MVSLWGAAAVQAVAPPAPSDKVTVEKVTFQHRVLINVVGDMYVPKNIDTSEKPAAIVVGHPFGGVTRTQAAEAVTQLAFYAGWSRAMSALPVVKTVFAQHH